MFGVSEQTTKKSEKTRICKMCHTVFEGRGETCSDACRQKWYRTQRALQLYRDLRMYEQDYHYN